MLFLLIFVISFVLQLILPWWIATLVAFLTCALIAKSAKQSLLNSFLAIFLLWSGVALYRTLPNQNILATRVSEMFMLDFTGNWLVMVILTAIIGGLAAAVSGLAGYYLRIALKRD